MTIASVLFLTAFAAAVAYWVLWSHRDNVPLGGAAIKAASVALLAGLAGHWPVALGLALGAVGDFALSRRGQAAFLAGMAGFALGHLAYAAAFLARIGPLQPVAFWALAGLLISTEFWLAPRTGALRWPVRAYVVVIGVMVVLALPLAPGGGRNVIWCGVALFVLSDLLLALRLFVASDLRHQRALSLVVWPTYWLGQTLILLGSQSYWPG